MQAHKVPSVILGGPHAVRQLSQCATTSRDSTLNAVSQKPQDQSLCALEPVLYREEDPSLPVAREKPP